MSSSQVVSELPRPDQDSAHLMDLAPLVTFEFSGVELVDIDMQTAVCRLANAARRRQPLGVHLCNAYSLTFAMRRPWFHKVLHHADALNLPDGTPVSWFYRAASGRDALGPVRGPGLMKEMLKQPGLRHYLLGGTPEVLADLERSIKQDYPEAEVVGSIAPPFREPNQQDVEDYARLVTDAGANVVWVGLGTPRQDLLISQLVPHTDAVLIGVGAAFDFLSGSKSEAPDFLHRTGLEWAYRLACEPRRLWRRYLLGNCLFIASALWQVQRTRRHGMHRPELHPQHPMHRDFAGPRGPRPVRPHWTEEMAARVPRVRVGAAEVSCIDERGAIDLLIEVAERRDRPWLVVTPNIQHVAMLERDTRLRRAFEAAHLVLADGWPVVRGASLLSGLKLHRVTGADLLPSLCERAAGRGLRVGIVGGLSGAALEAAQRLRNDYPGLDIVLTEEPPLGFDERPQDRAAVVAKVRAAELDLLFLALGTPKQEIFAVENLQEMNVGVTMCVGAAVDFVAGRQRRAPQVLRETGFEWAFRALHEPRRLIPRYAKSAPVFLKVMAREALNGRRRHG